MRQQSVQRSVRPARGGTPRRQFAKLAIEDIPPNRLDEVMLVSKLLSDGLPATEVARQLGKTKPAITKLKQLAKKAKILRVSYHPPRLRMLEMELQEALACFGIRETVVCASDVGVAAARYYAEVVQPDESLVLDGGFTVSEFVAALRSANLLPVLRVIPVCADPPSYPVSAYECMTHLALLFPGTVQCEKLPHLVSPGLRDTHRRIRRLAAKANTVVLGCGPWKKRFTASEFIQNLGLLPDHFRRKYPQIRTVCGYCALDESGRHVRLPEVEKLMPRALDFADIQSRAASRGRVMLLARLAAKAPSVLHSLRAGMINVLIVDQDLATSLLKLVR